MFGPDCLGQRIQAAAYGAIGCLPRAVRERVTHLWTAGNLKRLTEVMSDWIRGAALSREQFAHLFFGRDADDPKVGLLHGAARNVSFAISHAELSGGSEKIAAALQVIGVDRWPGFLADSRNRALDPATVVAIESSQDPKRDSIRPVDPPEAEPAVGIVGGVAAEARIANRAVPGHPIQKTFPVTGTPEQIPRPGQSGGGGSPQTGASRQGLPPFDITPPVKNSGRLRAGEASRPSQSSRGGQSLWDEHGGEWQYHQADTWNLSHWAYNEHVGPNSPWRTVPINNLPPIRR